MRPQQVETMCQRFVSACRERRVRLTAPRLAVYRALAADASHPTAERVHEQVRPLQPGLSLPSVYRILEALEAAGLICRVSRTGSAARFDANVDPHQHLACRVCGAMADVHLPTLPEPGLRVEGFEIESMDIRVVGRCARCIDAARSGPSRARPTS